MVVDKLSTDTLFAVYFRLQAEKKRLEKDKKSAKQAGNSVAVHIAVSGLDLVNDLLSVDGMDEIQNIGQLTEKEASPRKSAFAKAKCQAVALTLWESSPDMTIADLLKQHEIQEYGGAKYYSSKVVGSWISEVDKRPPEKKTGRPKNK